MEIPENLCILEITGNAGDRKGTKMNTILKTTAAAVSRKLASLGFEKKDGWVEVGYSVMNDNGSVIVANWTYSPSTAAAELAAAGYVIENVKVSEMTWSGRHHELFTVVGRVKA